MDQFDFIDTPKARAPVTDLIWNILTVVILLMIACVALYVLLIFVNPISSLNPFPPATSAPLPTLLVIPSATATRPPILPPTWTPTPTVFDATPTPTQVSGPTKTPLITNTPAPEPTMTPGGMSFAPLGEIQYLQDFTRQQCAWMGVAGQVFDLRNSPVSGLIVQLGGSLEGRLFETLITMSGAASQTYGSAGYELTIANRPVASQGTLWVQLLDQAGLPLSEKIYFDTFDACERNLIMISFKQVK
jgi:hypothetical protein